MERIRLPRFYWFACVQEGRPVSNFYTGSYGTDGLEGALHKRIFNYRVFTEKKTITVDKTAEEIEAEKAAAAEKTPEEALEIITTKEISIEIFIAESYVIEAFENGGGRTAEKREEFDRTEEGLEKIADWLTQNAREEGF